MAWKIKTTSIAPQVKILLTIVSCVGFAGGTSLVYAAEQAHPKPATPAAKPQATTTTAQAAKKPAAPVATPPAEPQIRWESLTLDQQKILAPMGSEWRNIDAKQQKHLLGITKSYPKMSAIQQRRFQQHLVEWSKLTPEQRALARKNYQMLRSLSPAERNEVKQNIFQNQQASKAVVPAPAKPQPAPAHPVKKTQ